MNEPMVWAVVGVVATTAINMIGSVLLSWIRAAYHVGEAPGQPPKTGGAVDFSPPTAPRFSSGSSPPPPLP